MSSFIANSDLLVLYETQYRIVASVYFTWKNDVIFVIYFRTPNYGHDEPGYD